MRVLFFITILSLLVACDRGETPGAFAGNESEADRPGASYGRKMFFLAGSEVEPTALLFRFTVATASDGVRRSARAWLGRDGDWSNLLEADWEGPSMRDAWRLVPHGPLRIVADDGGDVEALIHHDEERGFRLEPASAVVDWSPTELSHFRVRSADLLIGDEPLGGVLLDVQAGSLTETELTTTTAFLTDGRDLHLVVASGPDGRTPAWLRLGFREEALEDVGLVPDSEDESLIHLNEPNGQLVGELRFSGTELAVLSSDATPPVEGSDEVIDDASRDTVLLTTSGWVEVRGERRPVYGVVQHAPE